MLEKRHESHVRQVSRVRFDPYTIKPKPSSIYNQEDRTLRTSSLIKEGVSQFPGVILLTTRLQTMSRNQSKITRHINDNDKVTRMVHGKAPTSSPHTTEHHRTGKSDNADKFQVRKARLKRLQIILIHIIL